MTDEEQKQFDELKSQNENLLALDKEEKAAYEAQISELTEKVVTLEKERDTILNEKEELSKLVSLFEPRMKSLQTALEAQKRAVDVADKHRQMADARVRQIKERAAGQQVKPLNG